MEKTKIVYKNDGYYVVFEESSEIFGGPYKDYTDATNKVKQIEEGAFSCSCIKCGHKITSENHCNTLKCPKCGGQMRRSSRPGPGQP